MKKLILIGILILGINNAYGTYVEGSTDFGPAPGGDIVGSCQPARCNLNANKVSGSAANCTTYEAKCYDTMRTHKVYNCTVCAVGYKLEQISITDVSGCQPFNVKKCVNMFIEPPCWPCDSSTCTNDLDWKHHATGYEKKSERACTTCKGCQVTSTSYQCAAGYYGSMISGTTGCRQCPGGGQAQSRAGAPDVTYCYAPAGTRGSDATGSFELTKDCHYSN